MLLEAFDATDEQAIGEHLPDLPNPPDPNNPTQTELWNGIQIEIIDVIYIY
jgi:hypothetical protein